MRQSTHGEGDLAGSGHNTERSWRLTLHSYHGGGMEGGGGDSQSPLHRLHCLPQLPPWILGGLQYRDHHLQVKTAPAGCVHEGGGPSHNLTWPAQDVRRLGQVQVPGDPGGIWCGFHGPPPPPHVLGETPDGGASEGVLQRTLIPRERCDVRGTTVAHHIQCGGGNRGPPLVVIGGGNSWGIQQQQRCGTAGGKDDWGKLWWTVAGGGRTSVAKY